LIYRGAFKFNVLDRSGAVACPLEGFLHDVSCIQDNQHPRLRTGSFFVIPIFNFRKDWPTSLRGSALWVKIT
jgi:hypothetical protein